MRCNAFFFDFDGTLVDSADTKRQAFFDLFPSGFVYENSVRKVLESDPDASRYEVIPRIVEQLRASGIDVSGLDDADGLVGKYADMVLRGVTRAREIAGASELLEFLRSNRAPVYLCSNTPQEALMHLVETRGWGNYFCDVAGYPKPKAAFVREKLRLYGTSQGGALFIGDGESDREAAERNGIDFWAVDSDNDLKNLLEEMKKGRRVQG